VTGDAALMGLGAALIVGGVVILGGALLRRCHAAGDVFNHLEPRLPTPPPIATVMRCTCPARLGLCDCAVDGVRNPRGAGRGRVAMQDAVARQRGVNIDGSSRRETIATVAARIGFCPVCFADACETPAVCRAVERSCSKSFTERMGASNG
jgi:hypothetical protein